jgi:hypothetical protein
VKKIRAEKESVKGAVRTLKQSTASAQIAEKAACCEDCAEIHEDGCEVRKVVPLPVKTDI